MDDIYKKFYESQETIKEMEIAFRDILSVIYCIGGPLNDNIEQYTKNQQKDFFKIAEIAEQYIERVD